MKKKMEENREKIFDFFDSLLTELQVYILLFFLREPSLRHEFPKLLCVCKRWVTDLFESPTARQAIGMLLPPRHCLTVRGQRRALVR